MKSLKKRFKHKPIEHIIWSLPSTIAIAGVDLYSTMWAAMSCMFTTIAKAASEDHEASISATIKGQMEHIGSNIYDEPAERIFSYHASLKAVRLFIDFSLYLSQGQNSPLLPSLAKLKLNSISEHWTYQLTYPFHLQQSECKSLAIEARQISIAIFKIAAGEAKNASDVLLADSLDKGGGWAHHWAKGEQTCETAIVDKVQHVTSPIEIPTIHIDN